MPREKEADRAAEKRSAHYKDVISGPSCVTNRETIIISATSIKGDYKAPFLINISVGRGKERLTVPLLLDTECRLSAVIDYRLAEQLYKRL